VGSETEHGPALSRGASVASLAAALLLLCGALRTPPKNWLIDYYANPSLAGAAAVRAWVRNASFEVPGDVLLSRVPDRPDFSMRLQSCLPLTDVTELAVRLMADDSAIVYVDGERMLDSAGAETVEAPRRHGKRRAAGEGRLLLQPGSHLLSIEYRNVDGPGLLHVELSRAGVSDHRIQSLLRRPSLDGRCDAP
jgi:hypothetical protein